MTKWSFNKRINKTRRLILILLLCNLAFIWGNSLLNPEITHSISDVLVDMFDKVKEEGTSSASSEDTSSDDVYIQTNTPPEIIEKYPETFNVSKTKWEYRAYVRKTAHILEFLCFGLLCTLYFFFEKVCVAGAKKIAVIGLAVPITDELIQLFFDRSSRVKDVLIDIVGYVAGVAIAVLVMHLIEKRRRKKEQP